MSRISRSTWPAMTLIAAGLLCLAGVTPAAAREVTPSCVEAAPPVVAASPAVAPAIDGPWERIPLPVGQDADDQHLVVTGASTATLLWREGKQLFLAYSEDGGRTFTGTRELVDPDQPARRLTVGAAGTTIHLLSDMRYRRSTDGGRTWTAPRSLASHALHAALWTDGADRVVVAWWNRVGLNARVSTDGGHTFGAVRFLAAWDGGDGCALVDPAPVSVVAGGGSIIVQSSQARTIVLRSRDGGATWHPVELSRINGPIASDGRTLMAVSGYQGQVRISRDGGRTFGPRITAAPQWIDRLAFTGGRWWVLFTAGSQLKAQSSATGATWGDRTLIGPDTGYTSDPVTLGGHTVVLDLGVIAIRPD